MLRLKRAPARIIVMATLLVAAALPALADWANQNGGLQDLSTGLVWSPSQTQATGSWWSWTGAKARAADYVTHDYDEAGNVIATYSDWRLPTVKELQTAISNGTMNQLVPRNADGSAALYYGVEVWSSESRGNKAWTVTVIRDKASGDVIGGGEATLWLKGSGFESFFVRP